MSGWERANVPAARIRPPIGGPTLVHASRLSPPTGTPAAATQPSRISIPNGARIGVPGGAVAAPVAAHNTRLSVPDCARARPPVGTPATPVRPSRLSAHRCARIGPPTAHRIHVPVGTVRPVHESVETRGDVGGSETANVPSARIGVPIGTTDALAAVYTSRLSPPIGTPAAAARLSRISIANGGRPTAGRIQIPVGVARPVDATVAAHVSRLSVPNGVRIGPPVGHRIHATRADGRHAVDTRHLRPDTAPRRPLFP
jgi:hypothetical protein